MILIRIAKYCLTIVKMQMKMVNAFNAKMDMMPMIKESVKSKSMIIVMSINMWTRMETIQKWIVQGVN